MMTGMSVATETAWVPTDAFGNRLVLIRRELHLTVKEAAAMCGVHYATWSTWENGTKPGDLAGVVTAISRALHVDRDWLMWGGPLRTSPTPGDGLGNFAGTRTETWRDMDRPEGGIVLTVPAWHVSDQHVLTPALADAA